MRATHLLTVIFAATLPFAIVSAEDTAKPDADQKNEQNSNQMGMMGAKMGGDQGN